MRPPALCLAVAVLAGAGSAAAAPPSITLNGVPIDGATNQVFENCTVVIDDKGVVHIEAKGYAVKGAPEEPRAAGPAGSGGGGLLARTRAAASADTITRRYFIAAEQTGSGAQYDLGIFINAQWIREVKASEQQAVMEITKYLRPGSNKVTLVATKRRASDGLPGSADAVLRVVVGEGDIGGDHVMIDTPLVEAARTAAELDDRTEEFVITAR